MYEITKFVANDGKEFDYESDCREYELEQLTNSLPVGEFNMFDEDGKHTDNISDACYIVSNSSHASKYIYELANFYGYGCPKGLTNGEVGKWYYDADKYEWISLDELEEFYKSVKEILS